MESSTEGAQASSDPASALSKGPRTRLPTARSARRLCFSRRVPSGLPNFFETSPPPCPDDPRACLPTSTLSHPTLLLSAHRFALPGFFGISARPPRTPSTGLPTDTLRLPDPAPSKPRAHPPQVPRSLASALPALPSGQPTTSTHARPPRLGGWRADPSPPSFPAQLRTPFTRALAAQARPSLSLLGPATKPYPSLPQLSGLDRTCSEWER